VGHHGQEVAGDQAVAGGVGQGCTQKVADWLKGGGPDKVAETPYRRGIENRSLELEFTVEESKVRGNQVVVKVVEVESI
jgi:hypothetical protein